MLVQVKFVGLYSFQFNAKFTRGSGTTYGYIGESVKKRLTGLLNAVAASFSVCISQG